MEENAEVNPLVKLRIFEAISSFEKSTRFFEREGVSQSDMDWCEAKGMKVSKKVLEDSSALGTNWLVSDLDKTAMWREINGMKM